MKIDSLYISYQNYKYTFLTLILQHIARLHCNLFNQLPMELVSNFPCKQCSSDFLGNVLVDLSDDLLRA